MSGSVSSAAGSTVLISTTPTPLRGRLVLVTPAWPAKAPSVTATLCADFVGVLDGLLVTSAAVTAVGCSVAVQSVAGTVVTLQAAGGRDGEIASVSIVARVGDGSARVAMVLLPIVQLASDPPLPGGGAVNSPLVAAGVNQATATTIPAGTSVFASGAGGGVLPSGPSNRCDVANRIGAALLVYPPVGGTIETGALNAPVRVEAGGSAVFTSYDGIAWTAR